MKAMIIVGASSGIGKEIARRAIKNHKVYNISRSDCDISGVQNINCDVTNHCAFEQALDDITMDGYNIAFGVYCAGVSIATPLELADIEFVRYLFEVNYFASVLFCKKLASALCVGGKLVLVGSVAATMPLPYMSFYCASKAALAILSQQVNLECKPNGIRCVCAMPGGTKTGFTYKRKTVDANSANCKKSYEKAINKLAKQEQNGMNASVVAKKITKILAKKKPPLLVPIGTKNKLLCFFVKIAPSKLVNFVLSKKFFKI